MQLLRNEDMSQYSKVEGGVREVAEGSYEADRHRSETCTKSRVSASSSWRQRQGSGRHCHPMCIVDQAGAVTDGQGGGGEA